MILCQILYSFDLELKSENWLNQRHHIIWEKGPLIVKLKVSKEYSKNAKDYDN
jgi:hypothetical protein